MVFSKATFAENITLYSLMTGIEFFRFDGVKIKGAASMWVVLVRITKFGKEVKCHRHYFERKKDAESFAKIQHRRVEIYKTEMTEE